MAHQSETTYRPNFINNGVSNIDDLKKYFSSESNVFLISLPFSDNSIEVTKDITSLINNNVKYFGEDSLFCFLGTSQSIAEIYIDLHEKFYYQLSIAVKLLENINRNGFIPNSYSNLLILSKNKGSLKHTKTRISYTYCPVCDKTTKDYGGKKHLYHNYGTLISDVWRDITYAPDNYPSEVIQRLLDLFGLEIYKNLVFFDFTKYK